MIAIAPSPAIGNPRRTLPSTVRAISTPVLDIAAIEASDGPWADRLNSIAGWVYRNEGLDRWAGAWQDTRTLFGPASALRLLDLPELVELVDTETEQP